MANNTAKDIVKTIEPIAKYLVIGGVVYWGVLRPVMKKLIKSDEQEAKEKAVIEKQSNVNAWNPNWWASVAKSKIPNTLSGTPKEQLISRFKKLAKQIKDGFGYRWTNDDEIAVESAIRSCNTKIEISLLCWMYQNQYKINLFTELRERLSGEEFITILDYVDQLPDLFPKRL